MSVGSYKNNRQSESVCHECGEAVHSMHCMRVRCYVSPLQDAPLHMFLPWNQLQVFVMQQLLASLTKKWITVCMAPHGANVRACMNSGGKGNEKGARRQCRSRP